MLLTGTKFTQAQRGRQERKMKTIKRFSHNGYAATVETTIDECGYRAEVTCDYGWISSGRAPTAIGARRIAMRVAREKGMICCSDCAIDRAENFSR